MCSRADCDSDQPPPDGQEWCLRRHEIELERWLSGHLTECGPIRDLREELQ